MKLIVKDTNTFIDLCNTGLLPYCQLRDLEFHTTIYVYREFRDSKLREIVEELIAKGQLHIDPLDGEAAIELQMLIFDYEKNSELTPADCSVMLLAEKLGCRLLTGDQKLRRHGEERGLQVNDILWLVQKLEERNTVPAANIVNFLQRLLDTNNSAPFEEIMQLIDKYNKKV